ncbi:hypothetical protein [Picosynechococcus sp. PCC 7003]|uniref:hypothetical protein n=1 Tax=Picosynechococcus sp. PCC 7003 TaxID=374981 RepID=UPI0012ECEEFF|nr:hypothetical protein [Picosynechococcus sp. PCC 7003]
MAVTMKAKGKIENGRLVLDPDTAVFPLDGEVEVTVTLQEKAPFNATETELIWEAYLASEAEREEVYQRLANV